jgi:3-phosphoshikimate 1-carboxyvinyltransferase
MEITITPAKLQGTVPIPGSKSHTIRALLIASAADGESVMYNPLFSADTEACIAACETLGARVGRSDDRLTVTGTGTGTGTGTRAATGAEIDVGNSGTTLYLTAGFAALRDTPIILTGDEQIRNRPIGPLLSSLCDLGAEAKSIHNTGTAPVMVRGPLQGGKTSIECPTSQYLSSLLLACPLAGGNSVISVPLLHERPYVEMTLSWLDSQGISYTREADFSRFSISGGRHYRPFERAIPGDFSSATFFLVAAAVTGSTLHLANLDMDDSQGDKAVVEVLRSMGCTISGTQTGAGKELIIEGNRLYGREIDLNTMPDALPALAVAGCFAEGVTRLYNVSGARLKETDRITVMHEELTTLGADIEELPDGLLIRKSSLKGARVSGRGDHRVVMALAVAALAATGETTIETAEAVSITFPTFFSLLNEHRM